MLIHGDFEYYRPETLKLAIELAARWMDRGSFLAGGTDLVLEMKREQKTPAAIIDISRVPDLRVLEVSDGYLRLGAALPFAKLVGSDLVRRHAPALAQAASKMGSPQVRSVGTLGGNIATASAAGDSLPGLVAHDADVVIEGPDGPSGVSVAAFLKSRAASLKAGEIIREIRVPTTDAIRTAVFAKLGRRNALAIARISAVLAVTRSQTGELTAARLVLGAVAPAPVRVTEAERLIEAEGLAQHVWQAVSELASATVARSIPGRPSAPYKTRAVKGLILDVLAKMSGGRPD
jgi:CO/xanthine dehydrogenase FAD-binding subunit